jgi:hypothetical protein
MPFGGSKQSGIGRENGLAALDFYTERKSVYVNLGRGRRRPTRPALPHPRQRRGSR